MIDKALKKRLNKKKDDGYAIADKLLKKEDW